MNDYNFGNLLYELRTEKGLSQSELGEMFGVSNKAVSKWEMGISKPRPAMLIDLASFFGVSVEELMSGKRVEKQTDKSSDDAEIMIRVEEYNREKRRKWVTLAVMLAIFSAYLILGMVIIISGKEDSVLGPLLTLVAVFSEFTLLVLFFAFHTAQKRQKRALFSSFPEKTKEIKTLLTAKKPTAEREADIPKKWKYFILFFSILVFSVSLGNVVFQYTHSLLWMLTALVSSLLILGSISLLLIKFAKNRSSDKENK